MAPDPQEYWNYGSDEDFADAERWDGAAFPPPEEEEEEEEESEEEAKAPVTSLAVVMKQVYGCGGVECCLRCSCN